MRFSLTRWLGVTLSACACFSQGFSENDVTTMNQNWVGSWGRALGRGLTTTETTELGLPPVYNGLSNQTIRQIAHLTVSGNSLRLRLQNQQLGSDTSLAPVKINKVMVAAQTAAQAIDTSTNTLVTFNNNETSVEIAPGGEVLSDAVPFNAKAGMNIAISIFISGTSPAPSMLVLGTPGQTPLISEYLASGTGDSTALATFTPDPTSTGILGPFFCSGVEVKGNAANGTIVCIGDSITAGDQSTPNAYTDWPDLLAVRIQNDQNDLGLGVINKGIPGNRITLGGALPPPANIPLPIFGASALERLHIDIINQPVQFVIIHEGINDVFAGQTSGEIIDGLKQLVTQIRTAKPGIQIFGSTILPFQGNKLVPWTPAFEAVRDAVNNWILSSNNFNAVIDFATPMQDPNNPLALNPALASPDFLHPNDAGYNVMANTINLNLFQEQ